MIKILSTFLFIFLFVIQIKAQSVKDSCFRISSIGVHVSGQIPLKDMAKRFSNSLSAGLSFNWKTKHNVLFGVEGSYFFGKNVKEDVLTSLKNSDGFVTDNEGFPAQITITQRGWNIYANVGKVFSKLGHNPNSGLIITAGLGYMQHKIKLYDVNQKVAAIKGNLAKGYDRLSGGFALTQFIGYHYLSNNRLTNFTIGIEFYEGFTKSLRGFNYDTGLPDTQKRLDVLTGLRIEWQLPLYKRTKDFYYY